MRRVRDGNEELEEVGEQQQRKETIENEEKLGQGKRNGKGRRGQKKGIGPQEEDRRGK